MITRVIMRNEVTVRDIAEAAGVSHAAVLKVLNGRPAGIRVSPATRERVLAIVRQSGYRPNRVARDMALGRHTTLGLVMAPGGPDASSVHLAAIEAVLSAAGYRLTLIVLPVDSGAARERVTALLYDGVAGLLCAPSIWSLAAQVAAGMCPVITMGQGAGETILKALGVEPPPVAGELLSSPVVKLPGEIHAGSSLAPPRPAIPEPLPPAAVPAVKPEPPKPPPPVPIAVAAASGEPVEPMVSEPNPVEGGALPPPDIEPASTEPTPVAPIPPPSAEVAAVPGGTGLEPVLTPSPVLEPIPETPAPDSASGLSNQQPDNPATLPSPEPIATPPPVVTAEPLIPAPTAPIPEPEPAPVSTSPIAAEPVPEPNPLEGGAPACGEPAEPSPPDTEPVITEPTPIAPAPSPVIEFVATPPPIENTEPAMAEPTTTIPEPAPAPVFTPPIATEPAPEPIPLEGVAPACGEPAEPSPPDTEPAIIEPAPIAPAPSPVIEPIATPPPVENTEPAIPAPTTPIPEPEPVPVFTPPIVPEPVSEPAPLNVVVSPPASDEIAAASGELVEPISGGTEPVSANPAPESVASDKEFSQVSL